MNEKPKFNIKFTNVEEGNKETWEDPEVSAYMRGFSSHREENEIEKDYFFREYFNKAKEMVSILAGNYGAKAFDVAPKMVHILPHEDYLKVGGANTAACCLGKGIYIDQKYYKDWDELSKFMALCHELVHANSYQNILRQKIDDKNYQVKNTRSGLRVRRNSPDEFNGLNEAITVFLSNVLYFHDVENKLEFSRDKPKPPDNKELIGDSFDHYRSFENFFMDICRKISEKENIQAIPVFIRVYFNGGIEEIGKLLMSLGSGALNNLAKITDQKSRENLMRIVNFRNKYGLPEDLELNKYIENLKK